MKYLKNYAKKKALVQDKDKKWVVKQTKKSPPAHHRGIQNIATIERLVNELLSLPSFRT